MTLSVIGAGWGRTGTMSLKLALEALGLGPCHHMVEVIRTPGQPELWTRAFEGEAQDWGELLKGYRACVDWPSAAFWAELAAHYPDAKVILTVRDPDAWFDSTQATIFHDDPAGPNPPPAFAAMLAAMMANGMGQTKHDRAAATAAFRAHVEAVKAAVPPERLLVYEVGQGWGPLCAFLGLDVPAAPFPKANTTEEFVARREAMRAGGGGA
jgi:hypothetical protein